MSKKNEKKPGNEKKKSKGAGIREKAAALSQAAENIEKETKPTTQQALEEESLETETAEETATAEQAEAEKVQQAQVSARTVHGESVVDPSSHELDAPVALTKRDKFFRFMDLFGDLVFLNIVFVVGCVPILTIGTSFTALYAVTLKMVRKEEGSVIKSFWKAYKANLKSGIKVWLVVLAYFYAMYALYCYTVTLEQSKATVMIILIGLMMLLISFILPLLFPLVARYENTTFAYIRNALFISISRIGVWFRCFISWMAPFLLMLSQPKVLAYGWYVWLFLLCSLLAYSNSMMLRKLFEELEEKEKEAGGNAESAKKAGRK